MSRKPTIVKHAESAAATRTHAESVAESECASEWVGEGVVLRASTFVKQSFQPPLSEFSSFTVWCYGYVVLKRADWLLDRLTSSANQNASVGVSQSQAGKVGRGGPSDLIGQ